VEFVRHALGVGQAHAGAEPEGLDPVVGRRPALLHGELDVGDAGALVLGDELDFAFVGPERERAAVGMDDEVHFQLVGGDGDAADELGIETALLEHVLDFGGGAAGVLEVRARHAEGLEIAAGVFGERQDILVFDAGEFAEELDQQAGVDGTGGDDADGLAARVEDGKAAVLVLVEVGNGDRQRHVVFDRDDVGGHEVRDGLVHALRVEGLEQVFDADDAEETPAFDDGHAGNAAGLHQALQLAHAGVAPDGHEVARHDVAHAQLVEQLEEKQGRLFRADRNGIHGRPQGSTERARLANEKRRRRRRRR
jgi:hypothetical protein